MQKIVLFEAGWVGDTIVTIPAMRSIRKKFPDAYITRICSPVAEPILKNCPYIDRLLIYDRDGEHREAKGRLKLLNSIRKIEPDIFFNLHIPDINRWFRIYLRDNFFSLLTRARIRAGYYSPGTGFLLTHGIKANRFHLSKYIVDLINELTTKVGCKPTRDLELWVGDDEKNHISEYLKKQGVGNQDCVVAIHPGAKRPSRRWPVSRFIEISKWLSKDTTVVITGGKDEVDLAQQISAATPGVITTSGTLTLMQTAALLERCGLFITNDTGIMHMGFALKIPTVSLFGPGNVKRWVPPENKWLKVIHHSILCSPCYRWECKDLSCMQAITVDEVKEAVLELTR